MRYIIVLFLLTLGSIRPISASDLPKDKAKALEKLFDYLYENDMFNGSVGVKYQGEVIFKQAYGWGNGDLNTPMTVGSQTEIASVSKHFTAAAIMMLRDAGKLGLHDDINLYFQPKLPYEGVTIEHLLTHTSGMPDYEAYFTKHWNSDSLVYNKDIVLYLHQNEPPLQFTPGSDYQYSNLGYILLAEIVHSVSGLPLDEFLQERVFTPNHLNATGFYDRAGIFTNPNYAFGRVWDKTEYVRPETLERYHYVWYLSGRLGSGRITSTVDDMLAWDSVLNTESVLKYTSLQEMFVPRVPTNSAGTKSYGYGWFVLPEGSLGREIEHSGSWPGNLTYFKRYLDDQSAIVLLNNSSTAYMRPIINTIDSILKGETYTLPKRYLHEYLSKTIYMPGFDGVQWLKDHSDFKAYSINTKALERMRKAAEEDQNQEQLDFLNQVIARAEVK